MSIRKSLPVKRFFGKNIPYLWARSRSFDQGKSGLTLLNLLEGLPGHKFLSSPSFNIVCKIKYSSLQHKNDSYTALSNHVYRQDFTAPVVRDIMRSSARLGIIHPAIKRDVATAAESALQDYAKAINIYMPLDKAREMKKTLTEAVSFLRRHGFTELADKYQKEVSWLELYTSRSKPAWQEQDFADRPQWTFNMRMDMNMDRIDFEGRVEFVVGKDGEYSSSELCAIVQAIADSASHDDINRLADRRGATWEAPLTIRISRSNDDPATFWLDLYNKETETYSSLWGYRITKYLLEEVLRSLPGQSSKN